MVISAMHIRRTTDISLVSVLDAETFPGDDPVGTDCAAWWIAWDGDTPAGFAGARAHEGGVFLVRCGVSSEYRGAGVQRRLIRARCKWAKGRGVVYTYTLPQNHRSANNLIACGFRAYRPQYQWAGSEVCYWAKWE